MYDTSIGMECPNNGVQLIKCGLQGCAKYTLIELPQ